VGYQKQAEPKEWINSKLPERFSPYFLFDGERLDRFFRDSDAKAIRNSVLEIAQVDILELTTKHLATVSEDLTKDAAKLSGTEGVALAAEFERLCKRIEEFSHLHESADSEVSKANELVESSQTKMGDIAVIAQLMEQRKDMTVLNEGAVGKVRATEDELTHWALQAAPSAYLKDALARLKDEISSARSKQVLPPPFDPQALTELLQNETCICGRDLSAEDHARKHIEEIVAKYEVISEVGESLSLLEGPLLFQISTNAKSRAISDSILERLKNQLQDVGKLKERLDQLNSKLAGHDDSQVNLLHDSLKKAEKARVSAIEKRAQFDAELRQLRQSREGIEKKMSLQKSQSAKALESSRRKEFSLCVLELSRKVYEDLCDGVRKDVMVNLDKQFKKMIWKKDFISSVGIDDEFRVSVINNTGFDILNDLSAGERICLAFAYSLTLSGVAGLKFPFVADSPMGRLGPEVQDNLASVLAEETAPCEGEESQQLILLMTGSEYTGSVAKLFAKRKPMVYEIEFDTKVSETTITKEKN
jgi:DNA sulfur modification protein DndD